MRGFEKINYKQFAIDITDNEKIYEEYNIPKRSTKYSAGYDFESIGNYILEPGEIKKIPTGIKVYMEPDEVLFIFVRSSMGFKYNVRMCNQVGIIDSDYYSNISNDGHIWISLQNEGEKTYEIKKGDKICQGIFSKYLLTDNDSGNNSIRIDGLGSTN